MSINPSRALQRSLDVARLTKATVEEVEADSSATLEAGLIVVVTALVGAIGTFVTDGGGAYLAWAVASIAGWFVWGWATAAIAKRLYNVQTTSRGEMLRVIGYGSAPRVLGIIPLLGFVSLVWTLVVLVFGIRQAGEMTLSQAAITGALGMIPTLVAFAAILIGL